MGKKKGFSILKLFIVIVCFAFIIISVATNILFYDGKIPKIFDRYIYIVGDDANIGDKVAKGSAVIPRDANHATIEKGSIVLCYPSDDPQNLRLRVIYDLDSIGGTYRTYDDSHIDGENETITKDKILAVVSGYPESRDLGRFISFTISIKGILLELVLPCVLLVIFLIVKIATAKSEDDGEEGYDFYEYENDENKKQKRSHAKTGTPLFEASQEIQPSDELERKKMSIAENFSQKKVNPDSPYQKEKERTMQFKTQRSAESSFAARNKGGSSSTAPVADALREEMLRKTAEAERTASFSIKSGEPVVSKVPDNTGVLSKAQLAEMARGEVPKTSPLKSPSAQQTAPKKSNTPDITDIIKKSDSNSRKKSAANMSVDDLLKLIEDEKSKL